MRNTGLKNRFPNAVRNEWLFWHSCMVCGENRFDALHHIVSPTLRQYVDGDHNKSVLNSCPIHNMKCHIGKDYLLHKPETITQLLWKTRRTLTEHLGYKFRQKDLLFLKIYNQLYEEK